jgi:ElaA protein
MKIVYNIHPFKPLNGTEIYAILQLRNAVFVVEQNCAYQDLDDKDFLSWHVCGCDKNGVLQAYARILPPGLSYPEVSIGRVLVSSEIRGTGEGHRLMQFCMDNIARLYQHPSIRISAQTYLKAFYESHGFGTTGKAYLEDGIPHIEMIYYPILAK